MKLNDAIKSTMDGETYKFFSDLFIEEKEKLEKLTSGLYEIEESGGLSLEQHVRSAARSTESEDLVKKLIKYGFLGVARRYLTIGDEERIIYDKLDPRVASLESHPKGIEVYYELKKEAGYPEESLPEVFNEVLSNYDKLKEQMPKPSYKPEHRLLAAAIALTCRGKFQCPTDMRHYFELAGGMRSVRRYSELIDTQLSYDSDVRVKSWIPKLKGSHIGFYFDGGMARDMMEIWHEERGRAQRIDTAYVSALAHVVLNANGQQTTKVDVMRFFNLSQTAAIKRRVAEITERQKDLIDKIRKREEEKSGKLSIETS